MFVHSNRFYAVFSCTLYRKIKLGTYFSLWHTWNDQVNDLFQQELHVKFLGCLVFFDVNFFQGLFWEFGDKSRQYRSVHNLSCHCLVLIQSPSSRNKFSSQVLSYLYVGNSFFSSLSKSSLLFPHDYIWNC